MLNRHVKAMLMRLHRHSLQWRRRSGMAGTISISLLFQYAYAVNNIIEHFMHARTEAWRTID
jgi:hypothetical protein